MLVPGSNLLTMALRVIARQSFSYSQNTGRTLEPNGLYVASYTSPITVTGSVQAVPRNLYQMYGLDFNKNYNTFFVEKQIIDVTRETSGDKIVWNGQTFNVESKTDWYGMDGWVEFLAVQVA